MWETSTKGLLSLVRRTKPSSFTYICEKMGSNLNDKQMDELACFAPRMIALGSSGYGSADSQKFLTLAEEGSCHNFVVPSSASLSARHGPSSTNAALLPSLRSSNNDSSKRDIGMSSVHSAEESSSRCELLKNCAQPSDQKTLKVRIKVGSDNLSMQKNAEIYTGLSLDVSPSSSLNESPTDSEGFSHEPLDAPEESPTSIL